MIGDVIVWLYLYSADQHKLCYPTLILFILSSSLSSSSSVSYFILLRRRFNHLSFQMDEAGGTGILGGRRGWVGGGGGVREVILMWEQLPGCVIWFRMERQRVPASIMDLAKLHLNAFSGRHSKALLDPFRCLPLALHPLPLLAIPAEYETGSDVSLTVWTCHQVEEHTR